MCFQTEGREGRGSLRPVVQCLTVFGNHRPHDPFSVGCSQPFEIHLKVTIIRQQTVQFIFHVGQLSLDHSAEPGPLHQGRIVAQYSDVILLRSHG